LKINKKVSVVIPVLNEEESLFELNQRIINILLNITSTYEIIYINDGSTDGTQKKLEQIKEENNNLVKIINFRKNMGKSVALDEGFKISSGELIFTLDADLQDLPEEIPKFLEVLEKGNFDVVNGWRHKRKDKFKKNFFLKYIIL